MTSADSSRVDKHFLANAMASFIQIAAVALLVLWCFSIVKPFLGVVVWELYISWFFPARPWVAFFGFSVCWFWVQGCWFLRRGRRGGE